MPKQKRQTLVQQVGQRIRAIRTARGLTQAQVAESAGCDPQTIQRAESGRYGLSLNRLEALARGLGVGISELFAEVVADVPVEPWPAGEAEVAAAWRRIPQERRELALRLIKEFSR